MARTEDRKRDPVWLFGGGGDLFPGLDWANRPDLTGSEASEDLQRAWVATVMAIRDVRGAVRAGSCFYINLAARPLVQEILGETVHPCAGHAGFVGDRGKFECGFRWRPEKWKDWIDATAGSHLSPLQDLHTWMETKTHIIDFSTGDAMGDPDDAWPPLLCWPKWKLPKHPREVRGSRTMLLWRNAAALAIPTVALAHIVEPIAERAFEIYGLLQQTHLDDYGPRPTLARHWPDWL